MPGEQTPKIARRVPDPSPCESGWGLGTRLPKYGLQFCSYYNSVLTVYISVTAYGLHFGYCLRFMVYISVLLVHSYTVVLQDQFTIIARAWLITCGPQGEKLVPHDLCITQH